MTFEELQKTWQASSPAATITIDAGTLLKKVRRNQNAFRVTIFWRDVREVVVISLVAVFFLHHGLKHHDWTDELLALAGFLVSAFIVADRVFQRIKQPVKNATLKACIESSIHQLSHQIWLLRNMAWWYLGPVVVALEISFVMDALHSRHGPVVAVAGLIWNSLIMFLVYWGIYRLNQHLVRKKLMPEREDLKALLADIE